MATRPFPTNARLTAIALAFRNPDIALIAGAGVVLIGFGAGVHALARRSKTHG